MSLKSMVKNVVKQTFPGLWRRTLQAWGSYQTRRWNARLARITRAFVQQHSWRVMDGPFEGMRYGDTAVCSALLPKLAGSYEAELHPLLQSLSAADYDTIVDVGCAEGYYAVGFARKWSHVQILAFDTDVNAQALCTRMAASNGVEDRVKVGGSCQTEMLRELIGPRSLLISDCEGYELELLQPYRAPELKYCDVLVELHDCMGLTVRPVLCERFADTHDIIIIDTALRVPEEYPSLAFLPPQDRSVAVDEIRPAMQWAFMKAKNRLTGVS